MLRLIGEPRIPGRGRFPSKGLQLAALVMLAPERQLRRSWVAATLWETSPNDLAFNNLRYVISAIRTWERQNSVQLFRYTRERVERIGGGLACDIELFLKVPAVDPRSHAEMLLDLYRGDLLEGCDLKSPELEATFLRYRQQFRDRFVEHGLRLAWQLDGALAEELIDRLVAVDPLNEAIMKCRLANYLKSGRVGRAKGALQDFEATLLEETGSTSSLEMRAFVHHLNPGLRPGRSLPPAPMEAASSWQTPHSNVRNGVPRVLVLPPLGAPYATSVASRVLARALISEVTMLLGSIRTFSVYAPHTANQVAASQESGALPVDADYVVRTLLLPAKRHGQTPSLGFSLEYSKTNQLLMSDFLPLDERGLAEAETSLADAIAQSINSHISASELARFRKTGAATAFVHFLLGKERLAYDLRSIRKARNHFKRALELQTSYLPAQAMLARTLTYEWIVMEQRDSELLLTAQRLATRVMKLDQLDTMGHWELGRTLLYQDRLAESLDHTIAARRRSPNVADILADQADIHVHLGAGADGKKAILAALELNPLPPDDYHWINASADFALGQYEAALLALDKMKDHGPVYRLMAACAAMAGEKELANHFRDKWLEVYPDFRIGRWLEIRHIKSDDFNERMVGALQIAGFPE